MERWRRKEKRDEQEFKGRRTPASGSKQGFRGDVKAEEWLFECKQTSRKGYSITTDNWKKIYEQALLSGRKPAFSIELSDGSEIVIISKDDFIELGGIMNDIN